MSEGRLSFTLSQLVIGRGVEPFSITDFIGETSTSDPTLIGGDLVSIKKTEVERLEERFLTAYFKEGAKFPYAATVFDAKGMSEINNPRPVDNIELRDHLFVLIDTKTQKIYFTDYGQRNRIKLWLQKNIGDGKEVSIKPIFSEKEVVDRIKSLETVELTVVPGALFAGIGGETLTHIMNHDALGHGAVEARLEIKYNKPVVPILRDALKRLWENKAAYKKVTIVGKDVDNLDSTINTSEIVTRVVIKSTKDASGQFVPSEVFLALIDEIKKTDEE